MAPILSRVGFHWRATMQHDTVPKWDMWLKEIEELGIGTLFICHDAGGMRNYNPLTGELDPNGIPTNAIPGIEGMIDHHFIFEKSLRELVFALQNW